jgi:hypothetical protein
MMKLSGLSFLMSVGRVLLCYAPYALRFVSYFMYRLRDVTAFVKQRKSTCITFTATYIKEELLRKKQSIAIVWRH